MHRLKTKRTKKTNNCLLVSFQPQWNVTDEYFVPHFIQKAHLVCSRLCGWVSACVYEHRWVWSRSPFGLWFQRPFPWFQKSVFGDACGHAMPLSEPCNPPPPPIFTIHLCVDAAVKSTNTLINHTSKSNVKPLLRGKKVFFFSFFK